MFVLVTHGSKRVKHLAQEHNTITNTGHNPWPFHPGTSAPISPSRSPPQCNGTLYLQTILWKAFADYLIAKSYQFSLLWIQHVLHFLKSQDGVLYAKKERAFPADGSCYRRLILEDWRLVCVGFEQCIHSIHLGIENRNLKHNTHWVTMMSTPLTIAVNYGFWNSNKDLNLGSLIQNLTG